MPNMFDDRQLSKFMEMLHTIHQLSSKDKGDALNAIYSPQQVIDNERKKYLGMYVRIIIQARIHKFLF